MTQPIPTELADRLLRLPRTRLTLLAGIDGRGAAGKSTLARAVAALLPAAIVVEFDDFYLPAAKRELRRRAGDDEVGGDFDWRRLRDQVLAPLARDEPARYQRYDWDSDRLAEWHTIAPGGIVLVEGNYTTRSDLRAFYDLTVWVEAPHELRLRRGLERDGPGSREQWLELWMPEEERYIAAQDPRRWVDVVVESPVS